MVQPQAPIPEHPTVCLVRLQATLRLRKAALQVELFQLLLLSLRMSLNKLPQLQRLPMLHLLQQGRVEREEVVEKERVVAEEMHLQRLLRL